MTAPLGLDDVDRREVALNMMMYCGLMLVGAGLGIAIFTTQLRADLCVNTAQSLFESKPCGTSVLSHGRSMAQPAVIGGGVSIAGSAIIDDYTEGNES